MLWLLIGLREDDQGRTMLVFCNMFDELYTCYAQVNPDKCIKIGTMLDVESTKLAA